MADQAFAIRGPVGEQGAPVEAILRALPEWFGIEAAIVDYVRAAEKLPTFVALDQGETVGFVTLRPTSESAMEIHVMGVCPEHHRRGIGRALIERAEDYARAAGFTLLHVKTLAPSHPDPSYAATRAFYAALGFRPLEELPQVWGPENPCLLMVEVL
jgi:GNAT superfamily N-acetyltransferase